MPIVILPADRQLVRISRVLYPDPAFFGRLKRWRFDAPDGSFGVCYLGTSLDCCVVETVHPHQHKGSTQCFVTEEALLRYYAAIVETDDLLPGDPRQ